MPKILKSYVKQTFDFYISIISKIEIIIELFYGKKNYIFSEKYLIESLKYFIQKKIES